MGQSPDVTNFFFRANPAQLNFSRGTAQFHGAQHTHTWVSQRPGPQALHHQHEVRRYVRIECIIKTCYCCRAPAHTLYDVRDHAARNSLATRLGSAHVHSLDAHTTTRERTHSLNSAHMAHASRPLATRTHADGRSAALQVCLPTSAGRTMKGVEKHRGGRLWRTFGSAARARPAASGASRAHRGQPRRFLRSTGAKSSRNGCDAWPLLHSP